MSADEIAYWNREALDDPRYAKRSWGMTEDEPPKQAIRDIMTILDRGMPPDNGVVLEIGCGPGRLLHRMAWQYRDAIFVGTDISLEMLALCRRIDALNAENANVITHLTDDLLQFVRADTIDLVYCVELFQHLPDEQVRDYIEQAHEVLIPGGKFIAQFVTRGEPGPHSFPRDHQQIAFMFDERWKNLGFNEGAVHPDWTWVMATKA